MGNKKIALRQALLKAWSEKLFLPARREWSELVREGRLRD